MGEKEEEKKEEAKGGEEKKDEKKEGEDEVPEIVLKVDMHCEACARKVARSLKGFQGVEEVSADSKAGKVVVKGKEADPIKVWERLKKKSGRKVELVSPLPKPPAEAEDKKAADEEAKDKDPPKKDKKDEPPVVVTVALNVRMHCEACAEVLQKRIRKIKGVESVETDLSNSQVIVKGVFDPAKLVADVYKKTRKQVSIIKQEEEEKKKEEEKKEEENKEEKKEGSEDDKKAGGDIKRSEYLAPKYYLESAYTPQFFSDENPNACSVM